MSTGSSARTARGKQIDTFTHAYLTAAVFHGGVRMTIHRIDHGAFCVWKYNGPGKKARGFWHADQDIVQPLWAYALRSQCGTFWETSRAKGGFHDEHAATSAARAVIAAREQEYADLRADGGLPEVHVIRFEKDSK